MLVHSREAASDANEYLQKVYEGDIKGLTFGWGPEVDEVTMGLETENLVILAGETKGGKTMAAVNVVHANLKKDKRVLVVTTEVSAVQYMLRLVCREKRIVLGDIRANRLSEDDKLLVSEGLLELAHSDLFIIERPLCRTEDVLEAVDETLPDLVVVDHLQRMRWPGESPALGLKEVALTFKNMAVARRIPVLLLSQVTMAENWYEERDGLFIYHTSRMTTRWSKEPVMEADKVLVIHNLGQDYPDRKGELNLILHSMRDYASGDVLPMRVVPEHQYINSYNAWRQDYGKTQNAPY